MLKQFEQHTKSMETDNFYVGNITCTKTFIQIGGRGLLTTMWMHSSQLANVLNFMGVFRTYAVKTTYSTFTFDD